MQHDGGRTDVSFAQEALGKASFDLFFFFSVRSPMCPRLCLSARASAFGLPL